MSKCRSSFLLFKSHSLSLSGHFGHHKIPAAFKVQAMTGADLLSSIRHFTAKFRVQFRICITS